MKAKEQERIEARDRLRKLVRKGDTLYTSLRHVSRSGMQRVISLYVIKNNEPLWLSYLAAKALGWRFSEKHEGIVADGCGMDMGFHLVHSLSYALHGMKAPSCKCADKQHGCKHRPGYTLKQRWLG